ncbi:hypothetical protein GUITHDRAFT_147179 [Guillardia theta CCMP2712]|uniref:DUF819 protein n=1 Tax=Guillardia theta (strain CCMP2712) TaxID=905079 RepID=L1IF50_GUITC|nr:hypothetical protein GUITHDRAFT_147179 [Guillardia theta CCMP2712]EKX34480.1 hypothetical protein GUITHDRAFT_147179 [Guillardia theta CCMP2712]|eukprot:XP_005821460.1 hypothetical protein GUITHDRAFT_147179 [Guillardia theta CCMP2712]
MSASRTLLFTLLVASFARVSCFLPLHHLQGLVRGSRATRCRHQLLLPAGIPRLSSRGQERELTVTSSDEEEQKDKRVLVAVLGFVSTLLVLKLNPSLLALVHVHGEDRWGTWTVLAGAAWAGIQLEDTKLGKSLSGAVCAMLITASMAAVGVLPEVPSPHVSALQSLVVNLATPLLLLGVMLVAFAFGSLGTLVGATAGFLLARGGFLRHMGQSGWEVAAALTAKNIGGGLNFMGVVDALGIDGNFVSAALAVDNVLGLLYFPFVMWLGRNHPGDKEAARGGEVESEAAPGGSQRAELTLETLSGALFISFGIAAASNALNGMFHLPVASSAAGLAVLLATLFAPQLGRLAYSGDLVGRQLLYFFFASVGAASGGAASSLSSGMAYPLVTFGFALYLLHLAIILGAGRLLRIPLPDVLLASNANIGNPATAAAMANARGWNSRVLPAILSGTLGNIIGTAAGLLLGQAVLQPLTAMTP